MASSNDQDLLPSSASSRLSRREALKVGVVSVAALLSFGHFTPALADELSRLAHPLPMTGTRLASILNAERARWNDLLAQVGIERMDLPGVEGEWSVKQLVAHLTWYEQAVVDGAQQVLTTGRFTRRRPEGVSLDEQNALIAAESQSGSAADVLAEADAVFTRLVALIAACPQDLLNEPGRLGLAEDVVPWMLVANNSWAHYRLHEPSLRAWLEQGA